MVCRTCTHVLVQYSVPRVCPYVYMCVGDKLNHPDLIYSKEYIHQHTGVSVAEIDLSQRVTIRTDLNQSVEPEADETGLLDETEVVDEQKDTSQSQATSDTSCDTGLNDLGNRCGIV